MIHRGRPRSSLPFHSYATNCAKSGGASDGEQIVLDQHRKYGALSGVLHGYDGGDGRGFEVKKRSGEKRSDSWTAPHGSFKAEVSGDENYPRRFQYRKAGPAKRPEGILVDL
jgi:hypothetical protein